MFDRLGRLFRAWMGFFISMGEDPEVMLQDAIEEMRITMPRLNSVLVATRATVIRLEEEIKQRVAELKARVDQNNADLGAEQNNLLAWRVRKRQEEDRIAETIGYFVSENPITTSTAPSDKGGSNVR